jgi:hypothetical protein
MAPRKMPTIVTASGVNPRGKFNREKPNKKKHPIRKPINFLIDILSLLNFPYNN